MKKLIFILFFIPFLSFGQVPGIGGMIFSQTQDETGGTVKYGYLYNFYIVTDSRNITNTGWHVGTQDEWNALRVYYSYSAIPIRETGTEHWNGANLSSTNASGFNARGTGYRVGSSGAFSNFLDRVQWHGKKSDNTPITYVVSKEELSNSFSFGGGSYTTGNALRLVKDSTTLSHGETGTYTGNDGRVYKTICINGVEWLAEDLAETLYRDGTPIPTVTNATTWSGLTTGAKCAYDNDESNVLMP